MDMEIAQSCVGCHSDYAVSLVSCSRCEQLVRDPVMLDCLHTCCQSCLTHGATPETTLQSSCVECPVCFEATDHSAVTLNTLLCNYKRLFALSLEAVNCSACDGDGVAAAVYWCTDCCRALCVSCYSWHNSFHRRHRSAELEDARVRPLSQLMPVGQCDSHKRAMTEYCFTCRRPQCFLCYFLLCRVEKHVVQPLSHDEAMKHIFIATRNIRARNEQLLRATSGSQKTCRHVTSRLQELTADGRKVLCKGRRSLSDSTVRTFDKLTVEVCANLQRIESMCTDVIPKRHAQCQIASLATREIKLLATLSLKSLQLHRNGSLLKMLSHGCLSSLGALLSHRCMYWKDNGEFSINGTVPRTSDIVLRSCLGTADRRRAAPPASLLLGKATVTFQPPVLCRNLAVTRDDHVLLAAYEHGLLVYSDLGQQLSSWRPDRRSSGNEDWVTCVAALSDRRAAVGVHFAQLVVLLKQSETGDTWLEDRRVAELQSPPQHLAVHSDLLAASECRPWQQFLLCGREVKLLRLSSRHLLYSHSREYDIESVALTALCLLTVSSDRVKRNSGAAPYVLDAYSHSGEFLWRHETNDEDEVRGLCVSEDTWRRVYAGVHREYGSSWRVMAISGSDGRDMREVISSEKQGLLYPKRLSLARGQQRIVLAVMNVGATVSLYEATVE